MPQNKPRWRRAFDAAEAAITPRADALVHTHEFSTGAAAVARARAAARARLTGLSSRAWHVLNLPAGTDLRRLRSQLGEIDRELRRLNMRLEQSHDPTAESDPGNDVGPRPER